MRGAVWDGQKLHVTDELEVRAPGAGEARVRVLASGICHSDLNMMEAGFIKTPVVLGHEAAGIVEEIGEGVDNVRVGDLVAVGTQTPCGHCRECDREHFANCDETWGMIPGHPFTWKGQPVYSFSNCSSFAGEITVKASQLFQADGLAPSSAALIGCAVSTGYCAARTLGRVEQGDTVVVFGVGGIGVNALQGARIAGAARIVAVDANPAKEEIARHFGADAFVLVDRSQSPAALVEQIRSVAGAPIDVTIECSGAPSAIETAIEATKRGGVCVLIGMTKPGAKACFDIGTVTMGREIVAVMNGGANPPRDYPELIELARKGAIDIDSQVTRIWPLDQIEDAIAALKAGEVTRAVIDHTLP